MSLSPEWLLAIGILLVLSELALGIFVPIFFGVGFLIMALIQYLVSEDMSLATQLLIAFSSGTVIMLLLRKRFFRSRDQDDDQMPLSTFQGETTGTLVKSESTGIYQVKANGTYWRIANVGAFSEADLDALVNKSIKVKDFPNYEAVIELPVAE